MPSGMLFYRFPLYHHIFQLILRLLLHQSGSFCWFPFGSRAVQQFISPNTEPTITGTSFVQSRNQYEDNLHQEQDSSLRKFPVPRQPVSVLPQRHQEYHKEPLLTVQLHCLKFLKSQVFLQFFFCNILVDVTFTATLYHCPIQNNPSASEVANILRTLPPPPDCPKIVTLSGSPPKLAMFSFYPL